MITPSSGGKSLTTRLFAVLFACVFVSFVAATSITAYLSWTVYEGDAEERLLSQLTAVTTLLENKDDDMVEALHNVVLKDTRITLIAVDGTVLFDNVVDVRELGNHGNREEIMAARDLGESVVLRKSETTGTDALYAAAVVGTKGAVVRLAESRTSLAFFLGGLMLPLALAVLMAALLSALIARLVTRRIISPIVGVDLEAPLESATYREIEPLLGRIDAQRSVLLRQNEELERAVALRREFTGNVSHEMKSPLQVIGGYAELIESGIASPEDTQRFAGLIREESQVMRGLIDDVLTLSKLDEGAASDAQNVNVAELVSRVVDRLSSAAEDKGVEIRTDLHEGMVFCNEVLLEQAIYNLVDNAARYGNGTVEVAAKIDGGKCFVVVSDDGEGIPVNQRERIFERFYRLDASRSRSTGGTGLGLAIVKHAAETIDGRVFVGESELGGAAFTLELPAR